LDSCDKGDDHFDYLNDGEFRDEMSNN